MRKQAILSLLFGLFVFVGIGFSFTPVSLNTILGNVDVISVMTSENIFQMYPVYVKVVNPSLSGGSPILDTCFSDTGCDLNKIYFLISSGGSKKKVPQQILSNKPNNKISLLSEFSGLIYVNKKDLFSKTSTHIYLALAGQNVDKEKSIFTSGSSENIKLNDWAYYDKGKMDAWFPDFISDYYCSLNEYGENYCNPSMNNYLGFLLPNYAPLDYCGELDDQKLFAKQGNCLTDIETKTIKILYGEKLICNSDCGDFSENCFCEPLINYYTSVIEVINIPASFKSEFNYSYVEFKPITLDLCDDYVANVKQKQDNYSVLTAIAGTLDLEGIPYKMRLGSSIFPISFESGKAKVDSPTGGYMDYSEYVYFPLDKLIYSFGDAVGSDDDIGNYNVNLTNPDFKIICTYNYPSLEIQLK